MKKYIDAEKLIAEIRIIQQSLEHRDVRLNQVKKIRTECMIEFCKRILDVIDSLQQEQPDIDEIKREWYNKGYLKGRKESNIPARELGLPKSYDMQEQPEVDLDDAIEKLESVGMVVFRSVVPN